MISSGRSGHLYLRRKCNDILYQASGSSTPQLSNVLSTADLAVMILVPEKFRFVLSNDMDGTMRPWLSGDFTTSLKMKDGRSYFNAREDEFRAEGQSEPAAV